MKIKSFFLAFLAGALALVSCQEQEELGPAKVTVTPETLTFGTDGGSQAVSLTATRDWVVTTPEWMAVDVEKGEGHSKPVTVALSATPNPGNDRTGNVVFSIGLAKAIVTVNQAGTLGPVVYGDGTKANPFTVEGVIQYLEELGADVTSPVKVYVKGKVSAVTEEFTTQYGNGTFNISDDGEATGAQFTAYRVKYLGNKKFASGDAQPKKGDEVILYGSVVNYKGNTPETAQNDAFLYSLNGVNKGGDDGGSGGGEGEVKGSGTQADPYNVAAAIAAVKNLTWTSTTEYDKVGPYYVKGKISEVSEAFTTQYGNGTFKMVDEGYDASFIAYRVLYLGNKKFASGDTQIKEGDEVIIYAELMNYRGNTPESVQNSGYLYSLNGKTADGGGDQPGGGADPAGTGTQADPFNVAAAIAKAVATGQTATEEFYYIKGTVTGNPDVSAQYKNATFDMKDPEGGETFKAFRIKSFDGADFTGTEPIKAGDIVVVYGQIVNYMGNTPETAQGGRLVSINGKTEFDPNGGGGGGEQPGGEGGDITTSETVTVTGGDHAYVDQAANVNGKDINNVLKLGTSSATGSATITVPGDVSSISFYAVAWNGSSSTKLVFKLNGNTIGTIDPKANSGLKGNPPYTLTVTGDDYYTINLPASSSTSSNKFAGPFFAGAGDKNIEVSTEGDNPRAAIFGIRTDKDPGEGGGGGENPPAGDVITATVAQFLAAAESGTQKYQLTGTISNLTSTTYGNFDLVDDSGSVYVYGLTATDLGYGSKNDKSFESLGLAEGDNITIIGYRGSYNGKDEVLNAYFVKKNTGGGGENPPAGDVITATIAQFLAAAESGTQKYQLTGTISNLTSTTYGNFDLVDDSGSVYVYGLTATDLGYGSKNDKSFESLGLAEGDNITIIGYRGSYNGKDEVLNAYFVKKNTSGGGGGGENPPAGDAVVATVAQFLAAAESDTQKYQLTGTISNLTSTTYGNFDLVDDSGSVYVYGLTATDLGYGAKNDKSFGDLGLAEGDNITIIGYRGSYNGKDEVLNAYFVKKNASGGGNDNPGGDNPGGNEGGLFASNVEWTVSKDNASYSEKATVNGTADVPVLKLGTGSKYGTATLTLPEGTTSLTFYAVSWKGQPTAVLFRLDGEDMAYVEPAANDGLSNSSPYTLTVSDNDKYTVTFPATNTIDVVTSGSNKRAGLFAIQAGNEGGSGGGGSTLKPKTVSVAEFKAAEVSSTQPYKLKGTIGNLTNIQYGIFELSDDTGTVLVNGLTSTNLGYGAKNDFSFSSLGIKETDTITLIGFRSSFNFVPQVDYAYFYALNASGTGNSQGGGDISDYETDLSKINALANNTAAKFEGIVTAASTNSLIVSDGTNNVYVFKPTTMAAIGDKVRVDGTKMTYGGVPEIDSNATVTTVSQNNAFSYPTPKVITSTFDSYAATVVEYIEFTGTLAKSGNYYNVTVAGAEIHVGSISYPASDLLANLDGQNVTFTGYFVGFSGKDKYINLICVNAVIAAGGGDNPGGGQGGEQGGGQGGEQGGGQGGEQGGGQGGEQGGGEQGGGEQGGGQGSDAGAITLDFTKMNFANGEAIGTLSTGAITITTDKGSNNNGPKYYTTGTAIRFYGGNSFTISSSAANITKVEMTFGSDDGSNEITASTGTFTSPTWTGSASSVTFTIGGTKGHRRISKLVITLAE